MSYAVKTNTKANSRAASHYSQVQAEDTETLSNPLITPEVKSMQRQIDLKLSSLQQKNRNLEEIFKKLGTEKDNHKFRMVIKQKLDEAAQTLKQANNLIHDFSEVEVSSPQ
mmetsp:Transcript_14722/g.25049  ORF Transcript_14722/g.25049 Transcript_14722/m.25049 type:complete len:111 (-) Transcript_14722:686-1018(-)